MAVVASNAVAACDSSSEAPPVGASAPMDGPTAQEPPEPPPAKGDANTKVITPADVGLIEVHDVEITADDRPWKKGKVGPKKVLTSAPYLELAWKWPMSPSRGFVRVWNTKKPGERPADEVRLVDFETGVVRSYAALGLQYSGLGIARGKELRDGELVTVVIHASDGLAVPWQSPLFERQALEINGGTGQAWIVELDEEDEGTGRYIYWADTRGPPGTKVVRLPFPRGTFRPTSVFDAAKVPTLVDGDGGAPWWCPAVELLADGGWTCVEEGTLVFVDGWRMYWDESTPVAYNALTKERQRLELGDCGLTSGPSDRPTWDPPRALLYCGDDYAWVVWSPEGVVRFPDDWWARSPDKRSTWDRWSTDRTVFSRVEKDEESLSWARNWLKVPTVQAVRTEWLRDYTPYGGVPAKLVHTTSSRRPLFFDIAREVLFASAVPKRCGNVWPYAGSQGRWLLGCRRPAGPDVSTVLLDFETGVEWRFPAFVGAIRSRLVPTP